MAWFSIWCAKHNKSKGERWELFSAWVNDIPGEKPKGLSTSNKSRQNAKLDALGLNSMWSFGANKHHTLELVCLFVLRTFLDSTLNFEAFIPAYVLERVLQAPAPGSICPTHARQHANENEKEALKRRTCILEKVNDCIFNRMHTSFLGKERDKIDDKICKSLQNLLELDTLDEAKTVLLEAMIWVLDVAEEAPDSEVLQTNVIKPFSKSRVSRKKNIF